MIIDKMLIEGFRCYDKAEVKFNKRTAIIGRNGAGKSTVLHALSYFYDLTKTPTEDDYFNRDTEREIVITVTYKDLRPEEEERVRSYVKDERLVVTKRYKAGEKARYFGSVLQKPEFKAIREMDGGAREKRVAFKKLVDEDGLNGINSVPTRWSDVEDLMNQYEDAHPEQCELTEKETEFFGVAGGGLIDNYTKYVPVPAVHEVSEDLASGKTTVISQLLDIIVRSKVENREDIIALKAEIKQKLEEGFSKEKLGELDDLEDEINSALVKYAPESALRLDWRPPRIPDVSLPDVMTSLEEDGFTGEVSKKGHGLQRALIIALLERLAVILGIEKLKEKEVGTGNEGKTDSGEAANSELAPESETTKVEYKAPDLIFGIEEPELYQHPMKCRFLGKVFKELTDHEEPSQRTQIIYTTHSPYFVDICNFEDIVYARKRDSLEEGIPKQASVSRFDFENEKPNYCKITAQPESGVSYDSFICRISPIMNELVNEGFFADKILIVEGLSDVGVFSRVAEELGLDLNREGIAIIPVEGKNNISRPVFVFRGFDIPTYFVFDADRSEIEKKSGKDRDTAVGVNRELYRLGYETPVDFPQNDGCYDCFGCFVNDVFEYIRGIVGSGEFTAIAEDAASALGYSGTNKLLKNVDGAYLVTKQVYNLNVGLPVIEGILDRIMAMN